MKSTTVSAGFLLDNEVSYQLMILSMIKSSRSDIPQKRHPLIENGVRTALMIAEYEVDTRLKLSVKIPKILENRYASHLSERSHIVPIDKTITQPSSASGSSAQKTAPKMKPADSSKAKAVVKRKSETEDTNAKNQKVDRYNFIGRNDAESKRQAQDLVDSLVKNSGFDGIPAKRNQPYSAKEAKEVKERLFRTIDDL